MIRSMVQSDHPELRLRNGLISPAQIAGALDCEHGTQTTIHGSLDDRLT